MNLLSARTRKIVYGVLSAALFVYGIFEASQGDWTQFAVSLVTSVVAEMARQNTNPDAEIDY